MLNSPFDGVNERDIGKVDGGFLGNDASWLVGAACCHVLFHLLAKPDKKWPLSGEIHAASQCIISFPPG